MRYVFTQRVDKVEQRKRTGRTIKKGDDVIELDVTLSWVAVVGQIAFDFGAEKPELAEGDVVKWTLEKIE
jgi:hypothetical protein